MDHPIKHAAAEIANHPKTAHIVAAATTATGTSTWFDWIPSDIGKLASLLGVILTTILIFIHTAKLKKSILDKPPNEDGESCMKSPISIHSEPQSPTNSKPKT